MRTNPSPDRTSLLVGVALLALLGATVGLAHVDLGGMNPLVALAIAGVKAGLVLWFFMELRHSDRATWIAAGYGFVMLAVLAWLTLFDYAAREL